MNKKSIIFICAIEAFFILFQSANKGLLAQVSWTTSPYTQNFGTTAVGSWLNNSTFAGWYAESWQVTTAGTDVFQGTVNITAAAPTNLGGWYVYQCSGAADMKLGFRPSNNSGGPDIPGLDGRRGIGLGLCLQNGFGTTINSIEVAFDWYQLSLAQNGGEVNQNFFSYKISTLAISDLHTPSATAWTNVPTLNHTAPQSSGTCCSTQLNGYPCTEFGSKLVCFDVSIPAGEYIMLRWWNPNNANNDPHMAIDNVSVTAYGVAGCGSMVLPVELIFFNANRTIENHTVNLNWATASEKNNDYFILEYSLDGKTFIPYGKVKGNGNSNKRKDYSSIFTIDIGNATPYFRLKQVDYNGNYKYSPVITIMSSFDTSSIKIYYSYEKEKIVARFHLSYSQEVTLSLFDISGGKIATVSAQFSEGDNEVLIASPDNTGIYFLVYTSEDKLPIYKKIVVYK